MFSPYLLFAFLLQMGWCWWCSQENRKQNPIRINGRLKFEVKIFFFTRFQLPFIFIYTIMSVYVRSAVQPSKYLFIHPFTIVATKHENMRVPKSPSIVMLKCIQLQIFVVFFLQNFEVVFLSLLSFLEIIHPSIFLRHNNYKLTFFFL